MNLYSRRTNNSAVLSPEKDNETVVFGHMHDPMNLGVLSGKSWVGNVTKNIEPMHVDTQSKQAAIIHDRFRSVQTMQPVDREFGPSIHFSDYGVQGAPVYDGDRILRTQGDPNAMAEISKKTHQIQKISGPVSLPMTPLSPVVKSIPMMRDLTPSLSKSKPSHGFNGVEGLIPAVIGFSLIEAAALLLHGSDYINTETDMEEDNLPETVKNLAIEGAKNVLNFGFWNGFARSKEVTN